MSEPEKPREEQGAGIVLPPWIDHAISHSQDDPGSTTPTSAGEAESDLDYAVESAADAPPAPAPDPPPATTLESSSPEPVSEPQTVVADSPRDRARRAALPWIAAALFFTVLALILAYFIWLRPPQQ